ncbi:DNA gyrase subunit A [Gemmatimonadetes bacterium T265]|nr:DNA gyrase subunit A [Gemmatimonadetes bacterium T265]
MTAPNARERILPRLIDEEIKESFINYSMSVIVSRALPDVRDGLKPVQRRVLHAMNEIGLVPGRPYKKSATVVGDVLGKYHPHGDSSVYDALVRMVQEFSLRYPLVDGQGNFGSVDGDPAAAYRYTEAKLTRIATELLADIEKNTVNFAPNFDDRLTEPTVLPAAVPNLLVNGSSGIAVGMATNIPPHNLREVVAALHALIDDPELSTDTLRKHVRGPDFPTGAYIYGRQGIRDYIETGRGKVIMRARAVIEEKESANKSQIVVTELPYQVNKASLVKQIAELHREGKVEGISALRDESDRDGMRIVIELKRDAIPRVVLNQLYKHSTMQATFGVIMLALVPDTQTGRLVPKVMPVKTVLEHFVSHRHEVIVRRTQFELDKAVDREHILEGLKIAVDNIDAVIKIIRGAADTPVASAQLQRRFKLSEKQAEAILNLRLARLTGLAIEELEEELRGVRATIADLRDILASRPRRMRIMKEELGEIAAKYGDERRSEIIADEGEFSIEDLIAEEDMVVTISHSGYIKRTPVSTYRKQRRGGRGLSGQDLKDLDFIERLFIASTHDYIMIFTDDGRCYWLKVHEIPAAGRATRGKPIVNLINVGPETKIRSMVAVREFREDQYLFFATRNGTVKKTALSEYGNVRAAGVKAVKIEDGDELIDVQITSGANDVVLATKHGLSIRFPENEVRDMGRDTTGVKGITLRPEDKVVSLVVVRRGDATLLVTTTKGMGKVTDLSEYRVQGRGGKGILTLNRTERTGNIVATMEVMQDEEIMLITKNGVVIRSGVNEVRNTGRNAQGVNLVRLDANDELCAVARVVSEKEEEGEALADDPLVPDGLDDEDGVGANGAGPA